MTQTPEQKARYDRITEYGQSPRLLRDLIGDVFVECQTEGQIAIHNDAVMKITGMVGVAREDLIERVGPVVIEVAKHQWTKEKNGQEETT